MLKIQKVKFTLHFPNITDKSTESKLKTEEIIACDSMPVAP